MNSLIEEARQFVENTKFYNGSEGSPEFPGVRARELLERFVEHADRLARSKAAILEAIEDTRFRLGTRVRTTIDIAPANLAQGTLGTITGMDAFGVDTMMCLVRFDDDAIDFNDVPCFFTNLEIVEEK